ncbi:FtsK/SpoIIIE family DNA translocase [Anaerosporobacter faecicola]|uniref:FtsK/SpoIIIE family DNA translocase n=1 Tax=Anaerosporobacter faecicola TaxID=2718714 RepID=UPI00143C8742|nr:DNA translocase FtsK [Anaerosporobacter faecicola]
MAATQKRTSSTAKKTPGRKPSNSRGTSSGRKSGNRKKNSGHQYENGLSRYKDEVTIVVTLVIAVILVLSNFNLSGTVGAFINRFTFGLFGILAYLLPYLLFFGVAFRLSNKGNTTATIKLVSSISFVCILAAFIQLLMVSYNSDWNIFDYYTSSAANRNGGGLIGGAIYSVMYPLFGFAGTLVILLAVMTLLIMFITEKLLFASLGKKSSVKLKEMKERREEIKKAREEAYYAEEEYEEEPEEEELRVTQDLQQARYDNRANSEKARDKKGRKKKAKTYTFPDLASNNELNSPFIEANQQMNKVDMGKGKVIPINQNKTAPLDEVKPFDFDSIPIYRGDQNTNYDYEEKPLYKEEMKRKFSQNKDYDIKKLAEQIMNESFDGKTTNVDKSDILDTTDVENIKVGQTIQQDSNIEEQINTVSNLFESNSTEQSSLEPFSSEESFNSYEEKFEDSVEEQEDNSKENMEVEQQDTFINMAKDGTLEEENFDDFRVDLKSIENEEVEEIFEQQENRKEPLESAEQRSSVTKEMTSQNVTANMNATTSINSTENNGNQQNSTSVVASSESQSAVVEEPYVYEFPPVDLLSRPKNTSKGASNNELKETAMKLQQTLQSFGVGVTITNVSCGPAVTRYELQPEQGVKVSKITNLADDIKLNLAAADIRIEAPIPGKAAVGIEVPNKENTAVMLRELIESKDFKEHKSDLAFAVGKDIGGQVVVTDIAKMPHLLIAGATGSGKSVCINTLIMSILYKSNPDDVKLIMVDPKVVELSVYNGIPHLLIPVVTDPKKASAALNWAVMEMTDRYNRFAELGVRDIKGYNSKIQKVEEYHDEKFQKMPQIVIIVDELADLMMVAPGEVEDAICRLAQMARAAGIHLIIATQRPSVNVITGLIKANVPSRIAFSVSSAVDSRTIIDGSGAEKLLGKGDMLFFPSGYPKPVRIQGAFVSDKEVSEVVAFLSSQQGKPSYNEEITSKIASTTTSDSASSSASERDDYFVEAGKFIIDKDKASIGMLQRVYKIGFNRAARIMDQLYEAGVVGPEEGTKPRKILMSEEQFEQYVDEYV